MPTDPKIIKPDAAFTGPFRLLELPQELRDYIYELVVVVPKDRRWEALTWKNGWGVLVTDETNLI